MRPFAVLYIGKKEKIKGS